MADIVLGVVPDTPHFAAETNAKDLDRWVILLSGGEKEVEYLAKHLCTTSYDANENKSLRIYISSEDKSELKDLKQICKDRDNCVDVLNALLKLLQHFDKKIHVDRTIGVDKEGNFCGNMLMIASKIQMKIDYGTAIEVGDE